jgi:hypothetical protein
MNLREVLLFSSKHVAYTGNSVDKTGYIRVEEEEEEYKILFYDGTVSRTVYHLYVYGSNKGEPHRTCSFYDIDECEEFLKKWRINVDDNWRSEEEENGGMEGER